MQFEKIKCLFIAGVTASGKTHLAVHLARKFSGEIVSADSRQLYIGLDIGTGKDLSEYKNGGPVVAAHLLDLVEPNEEFHLFRYLELAREAIAEIACRGKLPIVAGGSLLYLQALLDGYDMAGTGADPELRAKLEEMSLEELISLLKKEASEELFKRSDLSQRRRVIRALEIALSGEKKENWQAFNNSLILAPQFPRSVSHQRIAARLDERLASGMIEEVEGLVAAGLSWEKLDWFGLEYRYISKYLKGELNFEEMREQLFIRIRQFCKRQETWLRKMEREGKKINWVPEGNLQNAEKMVEKWLNED